MGRDGRGRGRSPLTCGPGSAFTVRNGWELTLGLPGVGLLHTPAPRAEERAGGLNPSSNSRHLSLGGRERVLGGEEEKRVRVQLSTGGALGGCVGCWMPCPAPPPGVWLLNSSSLRVWRNC